MGDPTGFSSPSFIRTGVIPTPRAFTNGARDLAWRPERVLEDHEFWAAPFLASFARSEHGTFRFELSAKGRMIRGHLLPRVPRPSFAWAGIFCGCPILAFFAGREPQLRPDRLALSHLLVIPSRARDL